MTRAWPIVPLMSKKTSPTQNQARISLRNFAAKDDLDSGDLVFWLVFKCHRHEDGILAHGLPCDLELNLMRDSKLMECCAYLAVAGERSYAVGRAYMAMGIWR
jgi:hypothetical protein